MSRRGNTVLAASLKRFGKKIKTYIKNCIADDLKVHLLIEDARDSLGKASGAVALELEIEKSGGWGNDNIVEIHGTIGLEKSGKRGKKEDEAYLDGVTVGNWEEGSKVIGLDGCSIGEFLVHIFTLFAIKAGNLSILLDNAAGSRGEHIYKQVGFIKSKGDRAMYGEDNEMIFSLTGKSKKKDAGQLWRERYNKFRKKIATKIKNNTKCKHFWKKAPSAMEAPGPVHRLARGSKKRTRKKRGKGPIASRMANIRIAKVSPQGMSLSDVKQVKNRMIENLNERGTELLESLRQRPHGGPYDSRRDDFEKLRKEWEKESEKEEAKLKIYPVALPIAENVRPIRQRRSRILPMGDRTIPPKSVGGGKRKTKRNRRKKKKGGDHVPLDLF